MSFDDAAILAVEGVGKCFELYDRPIHRLWQTAWMGRRTFYREFWALRDINFTVRRGECVGIVGRNGSGKSTLLQIIAGTLAPTTGQVRVNGRVTALLELGSGFNPEFTGRENVYLNAAILGIPRAEVDARYDEILDFAGIGDFIGQPVKTYSSGMMVRLAFAVQVMVEPDIFIVDEALAVGDAAFQRKCYARLDRLVDNGMTLLLVTHDTATVQHRCGRVLLLDQSGLAFDGPAKEGVTEYMRRIFPGEPVAEPAAAPAERTASDTSADPSAFVLTADLTGSRYTWGSGGGCVKQIRLYGLAPPNLLHTPCPLRVEIDIAWSPEEVRRIVEGNNLSPNLILGFRLSDKRNVVLYGTSNALDPHPIDPYAGDRATVTYDIEVPGLHNGDLFATVALAIGTQASHMHMVWHDTLIQLCATHDIVGDFLVYFPTRLSVKDANGCETVGAWRK